MGRGTGTLQRLMGQLADKRIGTTRAPIAAFPCAGASEVASFTLITDGICVDELAWAVGSTTVSGTEPLKKCQGVSRLGHSSSARAW